MNQGNTARRFVEGVTMFVVAALSLSLLLYVSIGDGKRNYEQIQIESLTAQGRVVQNSIESYLRNDLPLKQYAGFATLAQPLADSEGIDGVGVYSQNGSEIFLVKDKSVATLPDASSAITRVRQDVEVDNGATHIQIVLPLRTRFETVGSIVVFSSKALISKRLDDKFRPLWYVAGALALIFAASIAIASPYLARVRTPWLQIGYATTFLVMSGFVILTMASLYFEGMQGKAKASASTLSQRLSDIVTFDLKIQDFDGLDKTFNDYQKVNPEISEAALLVDKDIAITTDVKKLNKRWTSDPGNFEYEVTLSAAKTAGASVIVTVPRAIVFERVLRSVKNFAALFIASAFLAGLFLQVASALQQRRQARENPEAVKANDAALIIMKPIFFLAVFLDSLSYSFLPKYMQDVAIASELSKAAASAPFTAYYLCFAAILIPAGSLSERFGPKIPMLYGLLLAAVGVAGMMLPLDIYGMTVVRGIAGIGQGMLIIGVQNYILAVVPPERKTQGTAVIVFGFQAGMISGMALGSLLVNYLHAPGIFALGGAVGLAMAAYTLMLIPGQVAKAATPLGVTLRKLRDDLRKVITSGEFLNTMLSIGAPAKAILTGVITFALPLVLTQLEYRPEDVGQIVMLYGLGVIVASGKVSKLVDRTKSTELILFLGALLSGIGLMGVGLMGSSFLGNGLVSTVVGVSSVFLVGIAHGFINAPVVTHISQSNLAKRVGANTAATSYRFLERGGHILGPVIVSQMFLLWGQGAYIIGWIGAAITILGLLFVARHLVPKPVQLQSEPAE